MNFGKEWALLTVLGRTPESRSLDGFSQVRRTGREVGKIEVSKRVTPSSTLVRRVSWEHKPLLPLTNCCRARYLIETRELFLTKNRNIVPRHSTLHCHKLISVSVSISFSSFFISLQGDFTIRTSVAATFNITQYKHILIIASFSGHYHHASVSKLHQ